MTLIKSLNVPWMGQQVRPHVSKPIEDAPPVLGTDGASDSDDEKEIGPGGGAWRQFVHDQHSNDLAEVGRLYKILKRTADPATLEELCRKG